MEEIDRKDWELFNEVESNTLTRKEAEFVSRLHAKYFNHKYKVPCTCSPKTIVKWIDELNKLYND
jgi:hypothetical protein